MHLYEWYFILFVVKTKQNVTRVSGLSLTIAPMVIVPSFLWEKCSKKQIFIAIDIGFSIFINKSNKKKILLAQ